MKYFVLFFFLFISFNGQADYDLSKIKKKVSYKNCSVYISKGKIRFKNCDSSKKTKNAKKEINKQTKKQIDKFFKKVF